MKTQLLKIFALLFLVFAGVNNFEYHHGAITRGEKNRKELAIVFTGDEFADGGGHIRAALAKHHIKASFFLTGKFYRNPNFKSIISGLISDGHYLSAHSDQHLLYCSWENRDSLLVSQDRFLADLDSNYAAMRKFGIEQSDARFFLPPYEWYNSTIVDWCREQEIVLVNFTPGTKSHTDWTYPEIGKAYVSSEEIFQSIVKFEQQTQYGLNGFILLLHIGSDPRRTDKFHARLADLIDYLMTHGYQFKRIDELLKIE